jgi:hypothetical protein
MLQKHVELEHVFLFLSLTEEGAFGRLHQQKLHSSDGLYALKTVGVIVKRK